MKTKLMKLIIPVLVLAMLLQVPFAFVSGASDLSNQTGFKFNVSFAEAGKPGDIQVDLFATTDAEQLVTTMGATVVLDMSAYDLVNKSGEVITSSYLQESAQLGSTFALYPNAFDDEDGLEEMKSCSLASYNSTSNEMYLFIAGLSTSGLNVAADSKIATFYVKTKNGTIPAADNFRLMAASEYKNSTACPAMAIAPAEISSKSTVFTAEDVVSDVTLVFDIYVAVSAPTIQMQTKSTVSVDLVLNESTVSQTTADGDFEFDSVLPGTYTINVTAPGSLGYVIRNVKVVPAGEDIVIPEFTLLFGNADGDDVISAKDIAVIINNFGKDNVACDADGDGTIAAKDIAIVLLANHFGKTTATQYMDLLA